MGAGGIHSEDASRLVDGTTEPSEEAPQGRRVMLPSYQPSPVVVTASVVIFKALAEPLEERVEAGRRTRLLPACDPIGGVTSFFDECPLDVLDEKLEVVVLAVAVREEVLEEVGEKDVPQGPAIRMDLRWRPSLDGQISRRILRGEVITLERCGHVPPHLLPRPQVLIGEVRGV